MQSAPASFLTFTVGDQQFGIRVDDVREIVRAVELARLPKAPAVIEGLIDLRGAVIPVFDIRLRFRLPPRGVEPADHIVIAQAKERVVGIRVDRATDILALPDTDIDDMNTLVPASEYVAGVARLPEGLVLIHDLATFLSDAEAAALDAATDEATTS
jgi:purine-binding chemotaxis protein CheW